MVNKNILKAYGSVEDNIAALKSLSYIDLNETQSKEAMASVIVKNLRGLSNVISYLDFIILDLYLIMTQILYGLFCGRFFHLSMLRVSHYDHVKSDPL